MEILENNREMVQFSRIGTKTSHLLLNPRFNKHPFFCYSTYFHFLSLILSLSDQETPCSLKPMNQRRILLQKQTSPIRKICMYDSAFAIKLFRFISAPVFVFKILINTII